MSILRKAFLVLTNRSVEFDRYSLKQLRISRNFSTDSDEANTKARFNHNVHSTTVPPNQLKEMSVTPGNAINMDALQRMYHQGFSIKNFLASVKETREDMIAVDQSFSQTMRLALGPDLTAAHFLVHRFGAIKLKDSSEWIRKKKEEPHQFPKYYDADFQVEALDLSNTDTMWQSFDNYTDLKHLKMLIIKDCNYFDDWCMDRLYQFADTLEELELCNCKQVSDNGFQTLHKLRKLKRLKVQNLPRIENLELLVLMLQDIIPHCEIDWQNPTESTS